MLKRKYFKCIFLVLLAVVFIIFSFKDHVYSKSNSNHDRGYESIAIDTFTDRIFATKEDEKGIDVIDIKTGAIIKTILSTKEIKLIAIDEQRKILVIAEEENKTISIISLDTLELLSSIPLKSEIRRGGEEPESIAIDSGSGILLITDEDSKLTAIDLNTNQILKKIKLSKKPVATAIDSELKLALIVHNTWGEENKEGERGQKGEEGEEDNSKNRDRDNITIIDLQPFSIIKTLQAGKNPVAVTVNTSTHEAAIANEKSNDITIIDLNSLKNEIATVDRPRNDNIKGTIPVGKHPVALSYNECLNTLAVIGGEDREWMQVIDMDTWTKTASYTFNENNPPSPPFSKGGMGGFSGELKDIKVHSYLNKAVIAGDKGLIIFRYNCNNSAE